MNKNLFRKFSQAFLIGLCSMLMACAATDLHLKPSYQPVGESKGDGALVILASTLDGARSEDQRVHWIIGEVSDSDGKVKGNVTSSASPAAVVRNALQEELLRAGYKVQIGAALPDKVARGLVLSEAKLQLDEKATLVKSEAESRVSISVEVWKNGVKTNTLSFESRFSDFALKNREKLHTEVLQKALAAVFAKAVPALVEQLGK